ncbi:MAG: ABC transporter transmembrane domain-containing protein, partial [Magnetococcus sp. DMHC-8]
MTRLNLFSIVKPHLAELLLVSLMINLLALVLPLVLLQIYDRILRFAAINTLAWLLVGVFVAMLLEAALRFGRSYINGWIGARFEYLASCGAMEHLLTVPVHPFTQLGAGVHLERLGAIQTLKEYYSGQAALVVLELPFVVVFLMLIYHLAGTLVWVPLLLLLLFLLFAWYLQASLYQKIKESGETDDKRIDFIIETLNGVHAVKAIAMETMMARRYERLLTDSAIKAREIGLHNADSQNIGLFFSQLSTIAMVTFGGVMVINQQLTVGGLVACSMLAGRALQPVQVAVGIWSRFQSIRIARERLAMLFALPSAPARTLPLPTSPGMPDGPGRLELHEVVFLGTDQAPLLDGLTLTVAPGEAVGIIGANGSGKTLLMELIMGTLSPTSGSILVDGVAPDRQRPLAMAYLPQEGVLFQGTILDNLQMFHEEDSQTAIESARRLGLEEFIFSLPKGYETP